jgi:hypothetical protein
MQLEVVLGLCLYNGSEGSALIFCAVVHTLYKKRPRGALTECYAVYRCILRPAETRLLPYSVFTFLPCFFFIFAGAPFIEAMAGNQRLQAALTGVTAAVVGVVLNLAVWFSHKVMLPNGSPDLFAVASAVISLVLLQKFHFPIHYLVSVGAVAGVIWKLFL